MDYRFYTKDPPKGIPIEFIPWNYRIGIQQSQCFKKENQKPTIQIPYLLIKLEIFCYISQ